MGTAIQKHYSNIRFVLILTLFLNWLVAFAKIFYGFFSSCASMTADGFHSLADGASNIIGLIGIHFASQPKDLDHPYGHKKYETLFSLAISVLLFLVAFNLFKEGLTRLYHPVTPQIDLKSFAVMLITLGVNIAVMNYERGKGKILQSDILISDSLHTKADIFTSLLVIITLIVIKLGYPLLDPIVTMLIAIFIAWSGYQIIAESSKVLCDSAAIVDVRKISDLVLAVKEVRACHKIRTRGRPDDIYIDLHVQVSPNMHIDDAHNTCYRIEETIKKNIPGVTDVIVHIEPQDKS